MTSKARTLAGTVSTGAVLADGSVAVGEVSGAQATLVSGTNIKTIGGASVLGSGDLAIASATLTEFSSSGTWTKPAGVNFVQVEVWGGGGGGGSGRRGATSTIRAGGGGGGGGGYNSKIFKASELSSAVLVTIGAGGTGGAARTADSSDGASGTAGGNTLFGSLVTGFGGGPGGAGSSGGAQGGGGGGTQGTTASLNGGAPRLTASGTNVQAFGGGDGANTSIASQPSGYGGGGGGGGDSTGSPALNPSASSWGGPGGNAGGAILNTNTVSNGNFAISGYWGLGGIGGFAHDAQTTVSAFGMAFGNGTFVQRAATGFISTSTNGTTWNIVPAVSGFNFVRILYDGTRWIGYTSSTIFTSTDLVNWRCVANISGFSGIAHFNGLYVSVGASGVIRTSPDLFNWSTQTSGTAVTLNDVIHDGTRWIVVGNSGVSLTSTNGISWTLVTTASSGNWNRVASSGSVIVATSSLTPFAWRSTDNGASWSAVATTLDAAGQQVVFANSLFVLTTSGAPIRTSTDGNTWASRTNPTGDVLSGIAYSGSLWAIGTAQGNTNAAVTSTDGTTWTTRTVTSLAAGAQSGSSSIGIACGGGGGAGSLNGTNSGAGGAGGSGYCRVYAW